MTYSPYGYVANNPTNNVDYNGEFILPKEFLNKFQKVAQYLAHDIQGILKNKRITAALKKHSGFSDKKLKELFTWGQGPVVNPTDMGENLDKLGLYGGMKDNHAYLLVNIDLFDALENAEAKDRDYWLFLIAVTILHETVHYGYDQNKLTTETNEEGNDFEKDAYGEVVRINNYKRILDQWKENKRPPSSSSNVGSGAEIFWLPSNSGGDSSATNKKSKKQPDADEEACKRSGGCK